MDKTATFLSALHTQANSESFIEIRAIAPDHQVVQRFHPVAELRSRAWRILGLEQFDGRFNVHAGVVPRVRRKGQAEDCGLSSCVWCDWDNATRPPIFPLAASLCVETSPRKYQAFFLLDTPTDDLARVEAINRAIAFHSGADPNACDRARVLRLPGFVNLKYPDHPKASLVVCKPDVRYYLEELETAWPAVTRAQAPREHRIVHDAPDWLSLVFDAVADYLESQGHQLRPVGGGGFITTCPLHDDRDPSLTLHPVNGWRCWSGCGEGRLTLLAARLGVRVTEGAAA
jgi:hypothetical protein